MRYSSVLWVFSALLAFDAVTLNGFAQAGEVPRLERRASYGNDETKRVRAEAEKGEARAQFDLGFLYLYGNIWRDIEANPALGMQWIRKSAAQGYAQAQDLIGCLLHRGQILAADKVVAVKWFRKAADQGDAYAQSNLGFCYLKGEGVAKDPGEAVRWFRLAAAKGEVKAQRHLGRILEAGEGVPKDYAEAAKWFFNLALQLEKTDQYIPREDRPERAGFSESNKVQPASSWLKAAEGGDTRAQFELGRCHESGEGVAPDQDEAMKWYRRSAQAGYAPAQFLLGYFHHGGHRLEYDHDDVIRWYRKAADQGYAKAQYNLGCFYGHGETIWVKSIPGQPNVRSTVGIPENSDEAAKWYRKAAEQGHVTAQYVMGKIFHSGKGVPKEQGEAVKWWRKAAEQGHGPSQFNLGVMCFYGRGTIKDFAESTKWFHACSLQNPRSIDFCGTGKPSPRPMVDGIQAALVPLSDIPEVR